MSSSKVPWEPYKAATKNNSKSSQSCVSIDTENLIRYNISTNLELFNARRPGYQFNDEDVKFVKAYTSDSLNEPSSFIDARFYTDFHFLKLADELKAKCLEMNTSSALRSPNSANKPVNIVVPLVDSLNSKSLNKQAEPQRPISHKIPKSHINKYEQKIEYLEDQMKGLYEHLQIQTQVNSELKKLLVASMGEDIQYKIERLVNDKERLNYELVNLKQLIGTLSEEVEQSSIKCDLWRSKFLACRLMSDEASTWKSFLMLLNKQNEKVLGNLLTDNGLLNEKLNEALGLLSELKPEFNIAKKNCNNFQAANILLLGLKKALKKDTNSLINKPDKHYVKTENEAIGAQMLDQFEWVKLSDVKNEDNLSTIDSFDKLEQLVERIKSNRSTLHSRLFQTTDTSGDFDILVNVCNRCKGKIQIV